MTARPTSGQPALAISIADDTGTVTAVWTGRSEIGGVTLGRKIAISGVPVMHGDHLEFTNPHYTLLPTLMERGATPPVQSSDLAAAFRHDGVVVVRDVLDQGILDELAEAVDENLAAPGPWANDYTPKDGTGRFFGDYVNWERIDGYRQAALHGPLPRVGSHIARRDAAVLPRTHPGEGARHARGHAVAPRRAVLLHRRRQQRQPVGATRPGTPASRASSSSSARTCGAADSCHASSSTTTPTFRRCQRLRTRARHRWRARPARDRLVRRSSRATSSRSTTAPCIRRRVPLAACRLAGGPSASVTSAAMPDLRRRPWLHSPPYDPIDARSTARRRALPAGVGLTATSPAGARPARRSTSNGLPSRTNDTSAVIAGRQVADRGDQRGLPADRLDRRHATTTSPTSMPAVSAPEPGKTSATRAPLPPSVRRSSCTPR